MARLTKSGFTIGDDLFDPNIRSPVDEVAGMVEVTPTEQTATSISTTDLECAHMRAKPICAGL